MREGVAIRLGVMEAAEVCAALNAYVKSLSRKKPRPVNSIADAEAILKRIDRAMMRGDRGA